MIYRGGKPVSGFALGVVGDPYAQAASDLADAQAAVQQGDTLASGGDYTAALGMYKTTGANGVAVLGPEIDAAGAVQVTSPHTQHAQMIASTLATAGLMPPATKADTDTARQLIGSMLDDYLAAIKDGRKAQNAGTLKTHTIWPVVVVPAVVGGLILLVQRKHGHAARR